jgi:hypothetical protein
MSFTDMEFQALADRIDKLESQNRKWKLATMLLAACSAPLFLMAAKGADNVDPKVIHARTVEAQDFVLRDEDGQTRARLTMNPKKEPEGLRALSLGQPPALQFYDDNGNAYWTVPKPAGLTLTH